MALVLKTKNMHISPETEAYIEKKTRKFDRFLPDLEEVRVDISREQTRSNQDRIVAEITVRANRKILRAEERSRDLSSAVDSAVDKLNRQIARLKGKQIDRWHATESIRNNEEIPPMTEDMLEALAEEQSRKIVRVKRFSVVPMNEAEAIEQMQLLSHDFFVFFNADVGRLNVLYKRADDNYGLLDPIIT
jgi:putative sigma-54 modulation protein